MKSANIKRFLDVVTKPFKMYNASYTPFLPGVNMRSVSGYFM